MSNMVSLAYDMRDLLENDDIESLGELLDQNWKLKRQMTSGISDPQIDGWYNKGILAGATGGKLLGAGYGGFMIFFAPREKHAKITHALRDIQRLQFSFDDEGSKIVFSDQKESD